MNRKNIGLFALCFCVLMLSACGEGNYVPEKKYTIANYKLKKLIASKQAGKLDQKLAEELIQAYKEIIIRYPYWPGTLKAYQNLANLYLVTDDPESAIEQYDLICKNYDDNPQVCVQALRQKAGILEANKDAVAASRVYDQILENYPRTDIALLLRINKAKQLIDAGEREKAGKILTETIIECEDIAQSSKRPDEIMMALDAMVLAYEVQGRPKEALIFITKIKDKYKDSAIEQSIMLGLGQLYENKFNDSAAALAAYREVRLKYPDSPFIAQVQERIDFLEKGK